MKSKDMIKILKKNGYRFDRQKGDHATYKKDGVSKIVTITAGGEINKMISKRLIKQIEEDGI